MWDPVTNEFGSFDWRGLAYTYFKPDPDVHPYETNEEYWASQPGDDPRDC